MGIQLANLDRLPAAAIPCLQRHASILIEALQKNLVGLYVHGSAAMGGFTVEQSDIDYLAVVAEPLSTTERRDLAARFLESFGQDAPAKGVEMSIVVERFCGQDFRYPTPFEFHMGTRQQIEFFGKPVTSDERDPDLAAHFVITKRRGVCIYGKPIDQVFDDVPRTAYLASIVLDVQESLRDITSMRSSGEVPIPPYGVLNACRVLAFLDQGLVTSKAEAGAWALEHLPQLYHSVVRAGLENYAHAGAALKADCADLKDFAAYANQRLNDA